MSTPYAKSMSDLGSPQWQSLKSTHFHMASLISILGYISKKFRVCFMSGGSRNHWFSKRSLDPEFGPKKLNFSKVI
jgi:hypothetical protein